MQEKRDWRDLALHGGPAAFREPLHVGRPNIGDRDGFLRRIEQLLDRRRLTNDGPLVRELERRIAAICDARHCIAVASGTRALEIAAAALNLRGDVLVPALTFVATPHAFRWLGLRPVFADVEPHSLTLDPADAERRMTSDTSAVVGVHLFGQPCDVEALAAVAAGRRIPLLLDASHALRGTCNGRPIGQFGDAEVFSLHATKFVGCGEGGAIVTNRDDLADRARRLRNFGFSDDGVVRQLGTNAKLSELHAALGLSGLDQIERIVAANLRNRLAYREALQGLPGVELHEGRSAEELDAGNCQYVIARVRSWARCPRDELLGVLQAENVLARPYFSPPCHHMPPYSSESQPALVNSESAAAELLALPTGESITPDDIRTIASILRAATTRPARAA